MSAQQYAAIRRIGSATVATSLAAAAWKVSVPAASKMLATMAGTGLVERLRRGVWLLDVGATPESLAMEITLPYPSYVSTVSALYLHGVIDQVPARIHLVSSSRPRIIATSRGAFQLHRIPIELFGGFAETRGARIASVEKALFDWAYISVVSGSTHANLPEMEWPPGLRLSEIESWLGKVHSPRIRTMTGTLIKLRLGSRHS